MFCTSCGSKNNYEGNFCKQCGLRLDKPAHNRISEQDFERAMPEDEQLTALLERAYRARKDGDLPGAIALCHEALAVCPNSTTCHSLLGQLYEQGSERDLAIEQYERVLALNPGSIADRVKLDELRGEVPSVISTKRPHPHIVLADRGKETNSLDYRIPSFVLACVALMVLGGIFTMQMQTHQGTGSHSSNNSAHSDAINPTTQPGVVQSGQGSSRLSNSDQNQSIDASTSPYSGLTGAGTQPIIIQTLPVSAPAAREYSTPGYSAGTARLAANSIGHDLPTTNSAQEDNKDVGGDRVILGSSEDKKAAVADPGPAPAHGGGTIKVNLPTAGVPDTAPATGDGSSGSNTRKNEAMADTLAQQGQYKQAGDAYIHALDGAGEDTAYIYRRAAWCFEKAGEKATAVSYYQHGIDAAKQLVSAGHQLEIARNLIRECQTGIRACTN